MFATGFGPASLPIEPTAIALVSVALYAFLFASYNGPANGLLLTIAPANVRGFTVALLQLGGTLAGYGIAPFVVGGVSDIIGGPNSRLCAGADACLPSLGRAALRPGGVGDPALTAAAQPA